MFLSFLSRNSSSAGDSSSITDDNVSPSLQKLVCELLSDKSAEEIPIVSDDVITYPTSVLFAAC